MCCKIQKAGDDIMGCDEYDEMMTINAGVSTFKFYMLCHGMDWHGLGHNAHFILCQTAMWSSRRNISTQKMKK